MQAGVTPSVGIWRRIGGTLCHFLAKALVAGAWMMAGAGVTLMIGVPYVQDTLRATCNTIGGEDVDRVMEKYGVIHSANLDDLRHFDIETGTATAETPAYTQGWVVCGTQAIGRP